MWMESIPYIIVEIMSNLQGAVRESKKNQKHLYMETHPYKKHFYYKNTTFNIQNIDKHMKSMPTESSESTW